MSDKNNDKKTSYIFTKETLGMTVLLFTTIVLLMLFTREKVFSVIGRDICTFMYGTFGYGSYVLLAALAYFGEWLIFGKSFSAPFKKTLAITLTALCLVFLFHSVTTRNFELSGYGKYISDCYKSAANGFFGYTFGGVISAIFVYPIARGTTFIGAYVIFSVLTLVGGYFIYLTFRRAKGASDGSFTILGKHSGKIKQESQPETYQPEDTVRQPLQQPVVRDRLYTVNENHEIVSQPAFQTEAEQPVKQRELATNPYAEKDLGRKILFEKGEFDAESYRRNMIFSESSYFNHPVHSKEDYGKSFKSEAAEKREETPVTSAQQPQSYSESYQSAIDASPSTQPTSRVYGEPATDFENFEQVYGGVYPSHSEYEKADSKIEDIEPVEDYSDYTNSIGFGEVEQEEKEQLPPEYPLNNGANGENRDVSSERAETVSPAENDNGYAEIIREADKEEDKKKVDIYELFNPANLWLAGREKTVEPDVSRLSSRRTERTNAELFDDIEDDVSIPAKKEDADVPQLPARRGEQISPLRPVATPQSDVSASGERNKPVLPPKQDDKPQEQPKHVWKKYVRPPLDLLSDYPENNNINTGEIEESKKIIVETLSRFKISSEVSNVVVGPAITRYDVIIEDKTNIKNSLKYREAIAMALMKDNVTAYLNYSKGALSIEVPNSRRAVVGLKGMLTSTQFINSKAGSVTFALGKNIEGDVVCPDITKMPHLLVAGTTGSGKSICLSSLIISLLYKYGPEELRFILVDPKQVEFISYDKLPHLMINEIIYDVDKAIKALNWAIKEMERRYSLFKEMTENGRATKNLNEYNAHLAEGEEKLPKIVIILDEFGDLMLQAKKDIEKRIISLVQKARACGIHLILATQRPSVDCITGLIKSNLPTRIGFKVNSFDDARTIFDIGGAEKLLGMGDMYFRSAASPDLARIQGCFVDTPEVQRVTDYIKEHNETYFDQGVSDFINTVEVEENAPSFNEEGVDPENCKIDDTYIKALNYCVNSNQASVSMIQRRFPVGYIKACKIIDWMEDMNYVTKSEGSKPRKVLLSKEEFASTYPNYGDDDD